MAEILRIAIQKKGRLSDDSIGLFKECGIKFSNGSGKLKSVSSNFPVEFLFLRDDDIPGYVADGVADLGVVGENVLIEKKKNVNLVRKLGFSKCRLSLAIPRDKEYNGLADFEGKNIATSYPNILNEFFQKHNISTNIHEISGSVEIAPGIGLSEAICDIVSSGSTLLSNGLKEVEKVFTSEAVLVGSPDLSGEKSEIVNKLLFRIEAVQKAKGNRYILLNAPNESIDKIIDILPGMKSPTVLPLAEKGWSSVHSVINEDEFWEVIEELKATGAEGVLIVPIEKMII